MDNLSRICIRTVHGQGDEQRLTLFAGLKREAEGSRDAAALATGRSLSNASTIRRIPIKGPSDPNEAEERRRKGREYLARRNQQILERQQRRKAAAKADGVETPPTPTFDELVDSEGKLKLRDGEELPSPPAVEPLPETLQGEMRQVERNLSQPLLIGESSSSAGQSGWQMGADMANPFSDEHVLERSITPKPPVPPKIELDPPVPVPDFSNQRAPTPPISIPGSFSPISTEQQPAQASVNHEELSYEEQLAIALSLSEQESTSNAATVRQTRRENEDEDNLRAAIAASLKDMDDQQAAHAIAHGEPSTPKPIFAQPQPLVDLTPSTPPATQAPNWGDIFDHRFSPSQESLSLAPSAAPSEASDELYRLTPELTRARLANFDAQVAQAPPSSTGSSLPYDPVRDAQTLHQPVPDVMDSSFYSAADVVSPPASTSTQTLDHETPQLVGASEDVPQDGARTPTSRAHSSFAFQTDSDSDTFASVSPPQSRPESRARSEVSGIEVVDLAEDSDVDMLSEEGDGIATPDSWSEVGSRDADSDMEDHTQQQQSARMSA